MTFERRAIGPPSSSVDIQGTTWARAAAARAATPDRIAGPDPTVGCPKKTNPPTPAAAIGVDGAEVRELSAHHQQLFHSLRQRPGAGIRTACSHGRDRGRGRGQRRSAGRCEARRPGPCRHQEHGGQGPREHAAGSHRANHRVPQNASGPPTATATRERAASSVCFCSSSAALRLSGRPSDAGIAGAYPRACVADTDRSLLVTHTLEATVDGAFDEVIALDRPRRALLAEHRTGAGNLRYGLGTPSGSSEGVLRGRLRRARTFGRPTIRVRFAAEARAIAAARNVVQPVCRLANAEFDAEPSSPAKARRFVGEQLRRWELAELVDTARLLTSELVSNAVTHANSGTSVVVAVADGHLEVGVTDDNPHLPPKPTPIAARGPDAQALPVGERGRGLLLVDLLADEWDAIPLANGKQVWYRLQATQWSYRTACICHADHIDRVRLQSGRWALRVPGTWDDP